MNFSTRILLLCISSFLAFSIGLNLGLIGFFETKTTRGEEDNNNKIINNNNNNNNNNNIDNINNNNPVQTSLLTFQPTYEPTTKPTFQPTYKPTSKIIKQSLGPISDYIENNNQFPIILLTCDRYELLEKTLQSLLKVKGISNDYNHNNIVIFQDGRLPNIAEVAKKYSIKLVQNNPNNQLRGYADGAARIASHYKFSLSKAFEMFPDAPAVIIVEDDLLFSPDFYQYFLSVGPILDTDSSVFVVSAWNDNGFQGLVKDPFELRRTDYFPGLGWMLSRFILFFFYLLIN